MGPSSSRALPWCEDWDYIETISQGVTLNARGIDLPITVTVEFDPPLWINKTHGDE
jgi:hypothetical protein